MNELLEKIIWDYENNFIGICELNKKYKIPNKQIREALEAKGYNLGKGVSPKSVVNIKKAVDEYIKILNSNTEPNIWTLAQKYEVSHTAITDNLKRLNVHIIKYPKIIQFNEHIFDEIDTEEKAYWLGFFADDGYITSRYNTVGINLSIKDLDHLKKYASFMGFPENIRFKNLNGDYPSCRCDIGNAHLQQTLQNYGFTVNKSEELRFPDENIFKSKDLIRHFIRGYCDGDGCVGISRSYPYIKFAGNVYFLREVYKYFNIDGKISDDSRKIEWYAELTYNGKKAMLVGDLMYKNSNIHLERKYNIYLSFCRCYKKL